MADSKLIAMTADIVGAYLGLNRMGADELPQLITTTYSALAGIEGGGNSAPSEPVKQTPAVPIKKSVTPDYLVSLEDGRQFKSLKRHLGAAYNMTPDDYRAKWGLPADYPMVAPNHAAKRSAMAKRMGLGRVGAQGAADPPTATAGKGGARAS